MLSLDDTGLEIASSGVEDDCTPVLELSIKLLLLDYTDETRALFAPVDASSEDSPPARLPSKPMAKIAAMSHIILFLGFWE